MVYRDLSNSSIDNSTLINVNSLYLKEKNQDSLKSFNRSDIFSKKFKVSGAEYFKDCPVLAGLIENKKLKKEI